MNDTADSGKSMTAMMMTGVVIVLTIVFLSVTAYLYKQASTRRLPDRDVLQRMYKEGNGEKWEAKYSSNWLQPCPISQWAGIEGGIANGNEHVLEILMRGNRNFTGPFPNIFQLINLVSLDLDHCKLSGPIPKEIGNLINLTYLNLSFNDFTGGIPEEIGNLQYLTFLNLNRNPLGGCIPASIGYLSKLEYLWLANCKLTGSIPLEIGHLVELKDLILCENKLTGKIPNEIGVMSKLDRLILSMNELSGRVPFAISQCKKLTLLYLDRNEFSGQLPVEITELPLLQELWLYRTKLTVDGHPIEKMETFLSERLPNVEVVVVQPTVPTKVLVRKDGHDPRAY